MEAMRVAIVTGGNKGVGLGIVRALCKKFDGCVYLTARDVSRGQQAVQLLQKEGLDPKFHQLDIGDVDSVLALRTYIKENHGGIDIIVNNAAIAFKQDATESFGEQAEVTLKTNYWDTKRACKILFPMLREGARVVNVSSFAGYLGLLDRAENKEKAAQLKKKLGSDDLTMEELDEVMTKFQASAKAGTHIADGWINSAYAASKIGLSALTRIYQRILAEDTSRPDLVINHVHPGYVDTDLSSHKGTLTIDRGAQSSVFAALLPPNTPIRGAYLWHNCEVVDWVNGPLPQVEMK